MATPLINPFTQFQLTDTETLSGQILNGNQLLVIQNLRAEQAIKKINLSYTPNDHQTFVQQEAELSGWLACLSYILDCHNEAQQQILDSVDTDRDDQSRGDPSAIFD